MLNRMPCGFAGLFPGRRRLCKVPYRARFRSDKHAAVLRLQRTQPKDRRVYDGPYSSMCLPEKPKAPRHRLAGKRTGLAQVVKKKGGRGIGMCIN